MLCVCVAPIFAQELPPVTVHIPAVKPSTSPDIDEQKIAQALGSILELRFNAIKEVQVAVETAKCEDLVDGRPRFQVNSSMRVQTHSGTSTQRIVELLLEYDVVRFMREDDPQKNVTCKPVTLVHRSEPISLKTAYAVIVRMSNLVKVVVEEESASPKIVVDVIAFTGSGVSAPVKDLLGNAILSKLAYQKNIEARSFSEKGGPDSDYVVTGEVNARGATFVVRNVKNGKSFSLSAPGPVDQSNADLDRFLESAATMVVNKIRDDSNPVTAVRPNVATIVNDALVRLCKQENASPDCRPQPALVIPDLVQLKDSNQATPQILGLLGDAYAYQEDYQKAIEAYDAAVARLGDAGGKEALSFRLRAAEASYKARQYVSAAERYNRVIELVPTDDKTLRTSGLFVQATRSYRFANDPLKALDRSLQGLKEFPGSTELDTELTETLRNMSDQNLVAGYEILGKYKDVENAVRKLSELRDSLIEGWAEKFFVAIVEENNVQKAEEYFRLIESLPVSSVAKESIIPYQLARAVWLRETKKDFAGAISSLERYISTDTDLGMLARYFLAETLYKRARSSSANPEQADYVRASTLLRQVVDKKIHDEFVLQLLVKSNHELGKDSESRELLERLAGGTEPVPDAQSALAVLCVDYIGDLVCGDRVLLELGDRARKVQALLLRLAGIRIFWAKYAEASELIKYRNPEYERYLEIELFYRVWIELALSHPRDAQEALEAWRLTMVSLRSAKKPSDWVFDTAVRALETDQALTADNKKMLREMIAAMRDPTQPGPRGNIVQAPATAQDR